MLKPIEEALKQGYTLTTQANVFLGYCTELWETTLHKVLHHLTAEETYIWLYTLAMKIRHTPQLTVDTMLKEHSSEILAGISGAVDPDLALKIAQIVLPRAINFDFLSLVNSSLEHDIHFVTPGDELWPRRLNNWEMVPRVLWYRGDIEVLNSYPQIVGMVGSRAIERQGRESTAILCESLALSNVLIVSGGAIGIDSAVHTCVLASKCPTVAVLACGLNRPYPSCNAALFKQIVNEGGALISAHSIHSTPTRWRFLNRNRLLAALTDGVVVVQASHRSGSLNTATHAANLGLQVGAVPGPIYTSSWNGSNRLIKDGANPITCGEDILQMICPLGQHLEKEPEIPASIFDDLPEATRRVLDAVNPNRYSTSETIVTETNLPSLEVIKALGQLEIMGKIKRKDGRWIRSHA